MIKFIRKMFEMFFSKRTNQFDSVVITEKPHVNTVEIEKPSKPLRVLTEKELEERRNKLQDIRQRRKLSDRIYEILNMLETSSFDQKDAPSHFVKKAKTGLLDGDLYFLDGSDSDITQSMLENEILFLSEDDRLNSAEAMWPIDFGLLIDHDENYYTCMRVKSIDAKYLRGKTKIVPTKAVIHYTGEILKNGQAWCEMTHMGLLNNKWRVLDGMFVDDGHCRSYNKNFRDQADQAINMAISCALTARYSWHVAFEGKFGTRLVIPTTPSGCLKMFKDRKGPSEGRRKALKHWVANHYRVSSADERDLHYVRDHLRGNTLFNWRGINCELLVSQYDLEKNELFREQADQWRSQRKHNSNVKVRLKSYK